ncbi:DUF5615 family PIN-like protein [Verrucomicrobia bacterium]|nr:DUF5615 family PIN-like protein [Verrucomicrobiota bacterium]
MVDKQLPVALARFLDSCGHPSELVSDLGMDQAKDSDIWAHAVKNGAIVVSKDEDFLNLATRVGDEGRFLWVRLGNCRKQTLLSHFKIYLDRVVTAFTSGDQIVELR